MALNSLGTFIVPTILFFLLYVFADYRQRAAEQGGLSATPWYVQGAVCGNHWLVLLLHHFIG